MTKAKPKTVKPVELTLEQRLTLANGEISTILQKYNFGMTIKQSIDLQPYELEK